ncbi:hypothetical protein [Streptomyces sp. GQFP]|uniref:hypothetical protein n=1 Tax=Streptomyces sp. GQFP TaxID=2907545 RepID=UPI001F3A24C1|nr:hypothetical protein [Streptomyces sp. GQFP]UIX31626.1 hypothetical protein LUX31_17140 [Streptomyces sp. GQFP]
MRKLSTLSLLLSFFLIEGCASGGSDKSDEVAEPTARARAEWKIDLPFDEYQLSSSEGAVVFAAQERLTADCMRSTGANWKEIRPGVEEVSSRNKRRYGVIDEGIAASYGYHMPPPGPEVLQRLKEEQEREKDPNSKIYLKAFGEDGFGGCARWAYENLLEGAPGADLDLYNELNRKSFRMSMETPKVEKVMTEWRKCVSRGNYRYVSPIEMSSDSRWFSGKAISGNEKKAAVVDAKCNRKVGLAAIWVQQEAKIQRNLIGANVKYFDDLKEIREINVSAARKVLRAE